VLRLRLAAGVSCSLCLRLEAAHILTGNPDFEPAGLGRVQVAELRLASCLLRRRGTPLGQLTNAYLCKLAVAGPANFTRHDG